MGAQCPSEGLGHKTHSEIHDMKFTLNLEPELDMQVRREAAKRGLDINEYVVHAVEACVRRDQKKAIPCLSKKESRLLQHINVGLPQETWQRYRALIDKRRDEDLTSDEHKELIQLSDHLEQLNVSRMKHLVELAQVRSLPVRVLMQQLGITPTNV